MTPGFVGLVAVSLLPPSTSDSAHLRRLNWPMLKPEMNWMGSFEVLEAVVLVEDVAVVPLRRPAIGPRGLS